MRARSGYLERDRMPRKAEHDVRPRLSLLSLGCDKNLCDSERMLGELISEGFIYEPDEERADVIIINTCCFIGDAKEESVRAVLEAAELKKRGNLKKLIVTGCMAERYKDEILTELPEVDAVIGTNSFQQIGAILKDVRAGERKELFLPLSENHLLKSLLMLEHYAHANGRNLPGTDDGVRQSVLSAREVEVMSLIVKGYINKEIADKLGIGISTVITHRKNLMAKLKLRSVASLTAYAVMNGFVDINSI